MVTAIKNNKIEIVSFLKRKISRLEEENANLRKLVFVDCLTGCGNRRFFDQYIKEQLNIAYRSNSTASLLIIDIDFFKKYNDSHGHQAGDRLLSALGNGLVRSIERAGDKVFRLGGEEFAIVLPSTRKEQTQRIVSFVNEVARQLNITVSIGVSDTNETPNIEELYTIADNRLYRAKASGRDQAVFN